MGDDGTVNKVGRPLKFESVEKLQALIDAYFTKCDEGEAIEVYDKKKQEVVKYYQRIPYTITGLALALDTTRRTLLDYGEREEFAHTIKRSKLICENYAELLLLSGNINAAGPIFALKNYDWSDKSEVALTERRLVLLPHEPKTEEENGDESNDE